MVDRTSYFYIDNTYYCMMTTLWKTVSVYLFIILASPHIQSTKRSGKRCRNSHKVEPHKRSWGTSLVAQWLRIRLPTQETRVRALVWEDPTCHGATKPVRHNYWACALEPASHNYWAYVKQLLSPHALGTPCRNYWACVLQQLKPAHLEPTLRDKRSHHNEKSAHGNRVVPAHCN